MPTLTNILPKDGSAFYTPDFISSPEADDYFEKLSEEINWQQDEVVMFGKHIRMKRMTAWFGDIPYAYTYSKIARTASQWTPRLIEIKNRIEQKSNCHFNSCLLNFYHDGSEGMGWHSDDETTLNPKATIASVSLGAERKFSFKHRSTKEKVDLLLGKGSLLLMKPPTQEYWLHALAKTKKVHKARINLTFRMMKG